MTECPAPDVPCIEGEELQNLNIWDCACQALEITNGTLFEGLDESEPSMFRGDIYETFTIRQWSNESAFFDWGPPSAQGLDCVEEIPESEFVDPWDRYR
jgi:hypothetical protein